MVQRTPVVMNDTDSQHQSLGDTDTIRTSDVPLSADAGNKIEARTDGIYCDFDGIGSGGLIGTIEYITDVISVPSNQNRVTVNVLPDTIIGSSDLWEEFLAYPYWFIDVEYATYYNEVPVADSSFTLQPFYGYDNQPHAIFSKPLTDRNDWFDRRHELYPMLYTPGLSGRSGGIVMTLTNQNRDSTPNIPISIWTTTDQSATQTVPYKMTLVARCSLYGSTGPVGVSTSRRSNKQVYSLQSNVAKPVTARR